MMNTIGMDAVAALATGAEVMPPAATITETLRATKSLAIPRRRS